MPTDSQLVRAWLTVQQRRKLLEDDLVKAGQVVNDGMSPARHAYALMAVLLSASSLVTATLQALLIARQLEDGHKEK